MRTNFITGGTGLIGRHLVATLLARGESVRVLLRPGSRARRAAVIDDWGNHAGLTLLEGDLTRPGLGLASGALDGVDHVYHLGAIYDLAASKEALRAANVDGTQALIEALEGFGGVLHHVSSVAVAGDFKGTFLESMFDEGQGMPHAYHRSKFDAEALVRESKLRWRIYRPAAVVGHSVTGAVDAVDGPYYLFKIVQRLGGQLPGWFPMRTTRRGSINMVPVDFVAAAIDAAAHHEGLDGQALHVVDPAPPRYTQTFNMLARLAGAPQTKRLGGAVGKMISGANWLGQTPSARFLKDEMLADSGVPRGVLDAFNDNVTFDAQGMSTVLAAAGLRCPAQEEYIRALWCYWLLHLDPDRDPMLARRARFAGQTVMITGASSGIGAELAVQCGELGADVLLVARRRDPMEEVAGRVRAAGGRAWVYVADLSDLDACDAVVEQALAEHGHIDILVNNAARSIRRPLAESLERFHDFERVMQLNYFAPVRLIRGVLPQMRERRSGHVVNVLTAGVALPTPLFGVYGSSKAALSHLTDTLAAEHLHEGIYFTAAYPGFVRTPMMDATGKYEDTQAMTPEAAARWIVDGVVQRQRRLATASTTRRWVLNGAAPKFMTRMLNLAYRIYSDDDAHSEFASDRAMLDRILPGRPL